MIWLLLLIGVAVIVGFVWNYRRQAAAREAASTERMKAFLQQARTSAGPPAGPAEAPAAAPSPAATPAATPAERQARVKPDVAGFSVRAQLLNAEQAAVYRLLKNALPDHEVFARVSLAALIEPAADVTGFAREAQQRRLADALLDFVVCDPNMKGVAAVQFSAASGKAADGAAFAAACVASNGMRWVEISPQALPSPAEIRQRVVGA